MSPAAGIGTERDLSAISTLETIALTGKSRDEIFNLLRNAKMDPLFWEELSAADALRMDFKHFATDLAPHFGVGIASVLQPLDQFIAKTDAREAVYAAIRDQNLNALVVMTYVHYPVPARDILICSPSREYTSQLSDYLKNDFELSPLDDVDISAVFGSGVWSAGFRQGQVKASRKQVAPAIQKFEDSSTFDYHA